MHIVAFTSPQDAHDGLDVWIWSSRFGSLRLSSGPFHGTLLICRILRTLLAYLRRPRSVLPDVGSQDLHDGPVVVFFGLAGDPFEGVDAAYSDLKEFLPVLDLPQLIDGPGEAIGDLPLSGGS